MIWWQRVQYKISLGKIVKILPRQHIVKKPVLVSCLFGLRFILCHSLFHRALQKLQGLDPSNHTYQGLLTTVFLAGFSEWEELARLWRTGRWTKPRFTFIYCSSIIISCSYYVSSVLQTSA